MRPMVYLASPYSHRRWWVRLMRFWKSCRAAAKLMCKGYTVFAPIAHSHPISRFLSRKFAHDHEFWMQQDLPILECCIRVFVLRLDGWEKSRGVTREIAHAEGRGIPVEYIDPE